MQHAACVRGTRAHGFRTSHTENEVACFSSCCYFFRLAIVETVAAGHRIDTAKAFASASEFATSTGSCGSDGLKNLYFCLPSTMYLTRQVFF